MEGLSRLSGAPHASDLNESCVMNAQVRVVHTVPIADLGGPAVVAPRLLEAVGQLGVRGEVITQAGYRRRTVDEAIARVEHRVVETVEPTSFGYSPRLRGVLAHAFAGAQVAHVHSLWTYMTYLGASLARRSGVPYVLAPHGALDPYVLRKSTCKKKIAWWAFQRTALRHSACLHALTEAEAQRLFELGIRQPVAIIPNGVEVCAGELHFNGAELAWVPDVRNDGRRVMLFFGRLDSKKGLSELVTGWAAARSTHREWQLVIAGPGDEVYVERLRQLVETLSVQGSVRIVGGVPSVYKTAVFRLAHCFILPSHSEGMPMAALEAMAHGLPSILSPQCNIPSSFDCCAALCVEPTWEAVRDRITQLAELSDAARAAMGQAGIQLVGRSYGWGSIGANMVQVYRWCLGLGSKPQCVIEP
jgi:glycosyltransferase involved in cell wall biosynthesis